MTASGDTELPSWVCFSFPVNEQQSHEWYMNTHLKVIQFYRNDRVNKLVLVPGGKKQPPTWPLDSFGKRKLYFHSFPKFKIPVQWPFILQQSN